MAGEQTTISDLRAVLSAHGFKETQQQMAAVKGQSAGVASGLKSLTDVMNKANAASQNVGNTLEKTGKQQKGFQNRTNRINQAVNQASFGLQDFILVLGNQGVGGAMRAASNNAAQMAFILGKGGVAGAVAGLTLTFASLLPDIIRSTKATKDHRTELEKLLDAMKRVRNFKDQERRREKDAAEQRQKAQKERDPVKELERLKEVSKQQQEIIDKERRNLKRAQEDIQVAGGRLLNTATPQQLRNVLGGITQGIQREGGQDPLEVNKRLTARGRRFFTRVLESEGIEGGLDQFTNEGILDRTRLAKAIIRKRLSPTGKGLSPRLFEGSKLNDEQKEAVNLLKKSIQTAGEAKAAMASALGRKESVEADIPQVQKAVTEKRRKQASEQIAKEIEEDNKKALQKRLDEHKNDVRIANEVERQNKAAARAAEEANKQRIKSLQDEKKALMDVLEVLDPATAKLEKIDEKFEAAGDALFSGALSRDPTDLVGAAAAAFPAAIAGGKARAAASKQKEKQVAGISGTFGVADFSRQLQNALLKDDTAKQTASNTKVVAKNTMGLPNKLDAINKSISNLKGLVGTFGP